MPDLDPVSPGLYRHYKGNLYRVLSVGDYTGVHENGTGFPEGQKMVTYIGLYNNPHGNRECVRPVSEWVESVETTPEQRVILGGDQQKPYRPRYQRIGD